MQVYLISALLFSLLVAVFAIQNTEQVIIKFLTFQFPISLVLVILGSAVVGALALYFLGLFKQVGSWIKLRQLQHQKEDLENQVKKLQEKLASLEAAKNLCEEKLNQPQESTGEHKEEPKSAGESTVRTEA
ncbi:DUF1049 domain-containing protein [Thermanaerosceptrum fracticalcis]|uniref:DUF1049 domain-containing protein n=1 Tax=Thermanaerosceptrum fracticalcis TaxID=1712410 RepID=A0A7G6DZN9_THEFR|nr:LapA family protein [Thermanaerosceptrum fracticalcis]QNB45293.1 DUF1049 domain-containing protein [Thermanaerosceptrum fracticalcis]